MSLQVSPSQVESNMRCPRLWWWESVIKMPTLDNQEQYVVGNVVHAVAERWMMADDNGRVPTPPVEKAARDMGDVLTWMSGPLKGQRAGDAVELYPEGWDAPLPSPALAGHVRKVVRAAIDEGVFIRYKGRIIERGYKREVIPGVIISGRMDVEHPGGVDDHKTTSARKWCMSEAALESDPKMLCYAHEWVTRKRQEGRDPEAVTLRLNYLGKDPKDPFVKKVDVDVEAEAAIDWWEEELVPTVEKMKALAEAGLTEKDWKKVQGPKSSKECKKYNGCDFAPICSRVRTPASHRKIIDRANGKRPEPRKRTARKGEFKMSLFKKARERNKGVPPTVETEVAPPTEAAERGGVAVVEKDPESTRGAAPWANPGCVACEGSGVSSSNEVCRACDTISARKKRPTSADYKKWNDKETGELCWKSGDHPGEEPEGRATRTAKSAKNATKDKPVRSRKRKEPEPEPEPEIEEPQEEVVEEKPKPKPKRAKKVTKVTAKPAKSAPKKRESEDEDDQEIRVERPSVVPGLVLMINAVYLRQGDNDVVDLHDILAEEGAAMAEELDEDVDSFYQLHPFGRKDMLGRAIGEIARELENKTVVAVGSSTDFRQMVDLLRPYAEVVIGGML